MAGATRDNPTPIDPLDHQGLVWAVARRCLGRGLEIEDLVAYGQFGLLRAIELFDPSRGFAFSTYASHWIRHHIWSALEAKAPTIRIPAYLHEQIRKGVRPDDLGPKQRECLIAAKYVREHNPLHHSDLESETFDELVADHRRDGPPPELADLMRLLDELPERERTIVRLRFGLDGDEHTLDQVGRRLGLTRERVRQIENEALAQLRQRMGDPEAPTPRENAGRAARRRAAAVNVRYHLSHEETPMSRGSGSAPATVETDDPAPNGRCPQCGKAYGKYRRCFVCKPTNPFGRSKALAPPPATDLAVHNGHRAVTVVPEAPPAAPWVPADAPAAVTPARLELRAMEGVLSIAEGLDPEAARRVLAWVLERIGDGPAG